MKSTVYLISLLTLSSAAYIPTTSSPTTNNANNNNNNNNKAQILPRQVQASSKPQPQASTSTISSQPSMSTIYASNQPGHGGSGGSQPTAAAAAVVSQQLAAGIALDILAQQAELSAADAISQLEQQAPPQSSSSPSNNNNNNNNSGEVEAEGEGQGQGQGEANTTVDSTLFTAAHDNLKVFVQATSHIRVNNQKLAGSSPSVDPQVVRALGQMQATQAIQYGLVSNMTGNAATDKDLLERFVNGVQVGLEKNQRLRAMVMGGGDSGTGAAEPMMT